MMETGNNALSTKCQQCPWATDSGFFPYASYYHYGQFFVKNCLVITDKLLTTNSLDLKCEKILGNNRHFLFRLQPKLLSLHAFSP